MRENDCVCRAISKALDLDYFTVEELLRMSAKDNGCECLNYQCYSHLLTDVFGLPIEYCNNWERVKDIAKKYPNNKVLIRMEGHLTMSDNGIIYDLFNCTEHLVTCYWVIPNKN